MKRPATFQQVDEVTDAASIRALSCSEALRSRGVNFCLFTPALLFTHGGFDRDPVIEFDARYGLPADKRPFCVQLRKDNEQFFSGLGLAAVGHARTPVNWNQRLYAIDEEYSADCFGFIGGITWSDPKTNLFASVMSYDLTIPDPTSSRNEFLTVKVFGVLANTFIAYLHERPGRRPVARRIPFSGGMLPAAIPRTNLLGAAANEDPLQMREGD